MVKSIVEAEPLASWRAAVACAREDVRVAAVLEGVYERVREVAGARALELRIVCTDGRLRGDRAWIVGALAELALAVIEWTPLHGRVAVTGQPVEDEVVFGIFATRPAGAPRARLDLPVIRSTAARIAAHHGRIWVDDQARDAHLVLLALPDGHRRLAADDGGIPV